MAADPHRPRGEGPCLIVVPSGQEEYDAALHIQDECWDNQIGTLIEGFDTVRDHLANLKMIPKLAVVLPCLPGTGGWRTTLAPANTLLRDYRIARPHGLADRGRWEEYTVGYASITAIRDVLALPDVHEMRWTNRVCATHTIDPSEPISFFGPYDIPPSSAALTPQEEAFRSHRDVAARWSCTGSPARAREIFDWLNDRIQTYNEPAKRKLRKPLVEFDLNALELIIGGGVDAYLKRDDQRRPTLVSDLGRCARDTIDAMSKQFPEIRCPVPPGPHLTPALSEFVIAIGVIALL
jgi:hypothetical protein